ncbi:MAG: DUF1549 domain-containing protein, partial [Planctomycetota bacterium]
MVFPDRLTGFPAFIGLFSFFAALLTTSVTTSADESPAGSDKAADIAISYQKDVLPILRRNCLGCHQGARQLGGYRMTDFAGLTAGGDSGEPAIVPGDAEASYLVHRIIPHDGSPPEMPEPPASPLSDRDVKTIRDWINAGAIDDSTQSGPRYDRNTPPEYHSAPVIPSMDVSPDGKRIVVAGHHEVLMIDVANGQIVDRMIGISPRINSVRFSPDGKRIAAVGGTPAVQGEVQIWDLGDAGEPAELTLSQIFAYDTLCGADWSPDGSKLAFGAADNVLRAIDTTDGRQVLFQGAHEDWVRDVGFTHDGKYLVSVARDMTCKLTEVQTERFVDNVTSITPGALSGGLSSVALHPTRNEIVLGGADGAVKVYRAMRETARKIGDDANLIRALPAIPGRIFSVVISPDGSRIAAAATLDGKSIIRVWNYNFNGTLAPEIKTILGKRVSNRNAKEKAAIQDYRNQPTELLSEIKIDEAAVYAIAMDANQNLFVATDRGRVGRYDFKGDLIGHLEVVPTSDKSLAINTQYDPRAEAAVLDRSDVKSDAESSTQTASTLDASTIQSIRVEPSTIKWDTPYAYTQLVVTAKTPAGTIDVTRDVQLQLPDFVITRGSGRLQPLGDGNGELKISIGQHAHSIPIVAGNISIDSTTANNSVPGSVDFIRDVNPVLSRLGCNQGTCHGAQKGKNGFKLSLRGYDPIYDIRALTDDLAARRINPASPQESLMLRKPLGLTPHEGGTLMHESDRYHAILRRWIADGSLLNLNAEKAVRLEIFPQNPVIQSIGDQQQFRLVAFFPDGSSRDVTREAFIESGNTEVATADETGLMTSVRRGEAPMLARYEGNYVATTLTVMGPRDGYVHTDSPGYNRIDALVAEKWQRMKIAPSGLCDDATFLRRVSLDLTGMLPDSDTVRKFIADPTPTRQKRDALVDELLAGDAYTQYWTNKWADLLQVNRKFLGVEGSKKFREWIRTAIAENRPYDQFAAEILTASGSNNDNPAASYFKILRTPEDTMENTTHLFLGIRFNCNKCHDHPFERWTQEQYFEMAAFFSQTQLKQDPASKGRKIGGTAVEGAKPLFEIVSDGDSGDMQHGRTGDVVPPQFPYAVDHELPGDNASRRQRLAAWMTDPDNPYFARSYANRLWGYLTGVGLIEPIDDIRAGNPPTNPALLDHLTQSFIDNGFDPRRLMREICTSRTYQLSVKTNALNADDQQNYSHALPRRLPAEVIYDAVHSLTGTVTAMPGMQPGSRAAEATDAGIETKDGFLQNLGRPVRESACECERSSDLQLGPIMALIGGPTVAGAIADNKNSLGQIVEQHRDDRDLANEIYLRSLGRTITDAEFATFRTIGDEIQNDHQRLMKQLADSEKTWQQQREILETKRESDLVAIAKRIQEHQSAIAPQRAEMAKQRQQKIDAANAANAKLLAELPKIADEWQKQQKGSIEWHPLAATKASSSIKDAWLVPQSDRSILAAGKKDKQIYTVRFRTSL